MTQERATLYGRWFPTERRLGPAADLYKTVALSFVIPSEAEGSAVFFRVLSQTQPQNYLPI
jgi:hypothetical protein